MSGPRHFLFLGVLGFTRITVSSPVRLLKFWVEVVALDHCAGMGLEDFTVRGEVETNTLTDCGPSFCLKVGAGSASPSL